MNGTWRRFGRLVLLVAVMALAVGGGSRPGAAQAKVPAGSAPFLSFPTSDPGVRFGQGWYYNKGTLTESYCTYPGGDVKGYGRHCAIDYYKPGPNGGHVTFPVTATADGIAYRASSSDGKMTIEHAEADPAGRKFCTRYSHLDMGRALIPVGRKVAVSAASWSDGPAGPGPTTSTCSSWCASAGAAGGRSIPTTSQPGCSTGASRRCGRTTRAARGSRAAARARSGCPAPASGRTQARDTLRPDAAGAGAGAKPSPAKAGVPTVGVAPLEPRPSHFGVG